MNFIILNVQQFQLYNLECIFRLYNPKLIYNHKIIYNIFLNCKLELFYYQKSLWPCFPVCILLDALLP